MAGAIAVLVSQSRAERVDVSNIRNRRMLLPRSGNRAQIGLVPQGFHPMAGPGRPGRHSAAAGFPASSSASLRMQLRPPAYLPDDARKLFNTIVINSKANHFTAADVPLLAAY